MDTWSSKQFSYSWLFTMIRYKVEHKLSERGDKANLKYQNGRNTFQSKTVVVHRQSEPLFASDQPQYAMFAGRDNDDGNVHASLTVNAPYFVLDQEAVARENTPAAVVPF